MDDSSPNLVISNRYQQIIEHIFNERYSEGASEIEFSRDDLISTADRLGIERPRNLGDIVYSFRYRTSLPESLRSRAPEGQAWVIIPSGNGRYKFTLRSQANFVPDTSIVETKILDATPGIISRYALDDEQGLLAKVRYNRLIDIFSSVTCYSLQNHLRTNIQNIGQIETDEIYIGVDRKGAHYVFPIQAKGHSDKLGVVQIEQDFALCASKFPSLICRPIAAQFISEDLIALFEFELSDTGVGKVQEKHYRLVSVNEFSDEDLESYQERLN